MSIPKLVKFHISAEDWYVVLTGAQAKQALSVAGDSKVWQTIYDRIIANKKILDSLLADYRTGGYTQCPFYTITFPAELDDAVKKLLPN